MSKRITIQLTEYEAEQLLIAASNVTDFDDQLDSCFEGLREINACLRAENKIRVQLGREAKSLWDKGDLKSAKSLHGM
jgi:hypothetical protein